MRLWFGRCRRGSGLRTRAGSTPQTACSTSGPQIPAPVGTGPWHPAPTSGRACGRCLGSIGPPRGDSGKSEPRPPPSRHRPRPAKAPPTGPWPHPFLSARSSRPPAHLSREPGPLLPSGAPPRRLPPPLRRGRSENPECGSSGPAAALSMLSS